MRPNWLIFIPKKKSSGDGYAVFLSEAQRFAEIHGGAPIVEIDANRMTGTIPVKEKKQEVSRRRDQVLSAVFAHKPTNVAMFCHGWRAGMQLGFDVGTADELAFAISESAHGTECAVALYSCSCGAGKLDSKFSVNLNENGDGGFADALRDALCKRGSTYCVVDAHATVGHTTANPYVRRFEGSGSPVGGVGGNWIVAPGSELWKKWCAVLKGSIKHSGQASLRLRYPDLTTAEVHALLLLA